MLSGLAELDCGRRFSLVSSIAAAGLSPGILREDMFEEAEGLDHPYFGSKHQSEKIVRAECRIPWRIYRPGIVVGIPEPAKWTKSMVLITSSS